MKNKWLILPLIAMIVPLTSCEIKDYKFDTPNAVIRNRSSNRGARLVYPYESNAEPNSTLDCHINDIDNIVINNLKKIKFKEGKPDTPNPDKFIKFTISSYSSKDAIGSGDFTLYANGYITYKYEYIYQTEKISIKTKTFNFNFDPSEAERIIDLVYDEFDKAKEEEERFLSAISVDSYFNATSKLEHCVNYVVNDDLFGAYLDDGRVFSEIKKLDYAPVSYDEGAQASIDYQLIFTYNSKDNGRINFEGGRLAMNLYIYANDGYACLQFYGEDCYNKYYLNRYYYSLDKEQAQTFMENTKEIVKILQKTK